jgi:hypothetical protein
VFVGGTEGTPELEFELRLTLALLLLVFNVSYSGEPKGLLFVVVPVVELELGMPVVKGLR